jgi:hypothetical protein
MHFTKVPDNHVRQTFFGETVKEGVTTLLAQPALKRILTREQRLVTTMRIGGRHFVPAKESGEVPRIRLMRSRLWSMLSRCVRMRSNLRPIFRIMR